MCAFLSAEENQTQWNWHGAFPWVYSHKEQGWHYWHAGTDGKFYRWKDSNQTWYLFDQTSEKWLNQAGWLQNSPQAVNEWYNPIVQSKMFLLNDVTIWNPFNTDYFFWLDAGITNTVPHGHLAHDNCLENLTEYGNP
ncbi:MAG: hypothetical protein EBX03_15305, partial [Rhodobacteraceae bacterium]|nr:hypothetical protein [Paracoccaceae bacterium]